MKFILKHSLIFYFLQFTWGCLMNIFGLLVFIVMIVTGHKPHVFGPSIYFEMNHFNQGSFEAGIVFVIGKGCLSSRCHEAGHGIQNIIFGPLTPFIVSIPSVIRYWYLYFKYYKKGKYFNYYSIWFERQATELGEKYYSEYLEGNI